MKMNKKELKKIDLAFRSIASRALQTHPGDAEKNLKMFVDFIDNSPLIIDYVNSFTVDEKNVEKEVNEVSDSYSREAFYLGLTLEEEIVWTYQLLKYLVVHDVSLFSVTQPYGPFNDSDQRIKGFCNRVILPFVSHIETYIQNIRIDMGADEEVNYQITTNVTANGSAQVNLAQDHATINATQNNGVDQAELNRLIETITALMPDGILPDDKELICESVEVIQEELKKEYPKKSLVKMAISGLKTVAPKIAGTVEFAASIASLVLFVQPLF